MPYSVRSIRPDGATFPSPAMSLRDVVEATVNRTGFDGCATGQLIRRLRDVGDTITVPAGADGYVAARVERVAADFDPWTRVVA